MHPVGSYYTDISRCTVNKTLNNFFIKVLNTLTRYELGQMICSFSHLSYKDRVRNRVDWRATTIRQRNYCALRHKERSRFQWRSDRESAL